MAASDMWFVTVRGKGGHGAVPQGTRDAIVAASHLVCSLQTIVSRNVGRTLATMEWCAQAFLYVGGFPASYCAEYGTP